MENLNKTIWRFEIDNLSEKEAKISSQTFASGGCEWFLQVHPRGNHMEEDHLSLYLFVANPNSLKLGWKRRAAFSFIVLNQSGKEHLRTTPDGCKLFCAQFSGWGYSNMFPLKKLKKDGFLEKNKLILVVQVTVLEVAHEGEVTGNEMLDYKGFQILYSQVTSVTQLFARHPDIALDFRPKNKLVKTQYMNLLLDLVETLCKPPQSFSEAELSNANRELCKLTAVGFKLDWLKQKLDKASLERTRVVDDGARIRELEAHVKNLKVELENEKAKVFVLGANSVRSQS